MQAISDNGIGVKEVLRKPFLDGATHSLLHRVIWCCRHVITIRHLQVYGKDKRQVAISFIVYLSIAAAYL